MGKQHKKGFCSGIVVIFCVAYLLLHGTLVFAQGASAPESLWAKTFGGEYDDEGYSVQQTSDGGYIVCGINGTIGSEDVYLIKTDAQGNTLWTKNYGGLSNDGGYSVQQTSDGGYIITGYTGSFGSGKDDVYLIKTDSLGDTQWTNTFGDINNDAGYSVQQTIDGGYIIAGYTEPDLTAKVDQDPADVCLIKTDKNGILMWRKNYGGIYGDWGRSVQQTLDGGYIIAGYTLSFAKDSRESYHDIWVIKTDTLGDTLWARTYGGGNDDRAYAIHQSLDGGYIITGFTTVTDSADLYLLKIGMNGNQNWANIYDVLGVGHKKDIGYSVQQTSDGGYIAAGVKKNDVYLVKTDSLGDSLWTYIHEVAGDDGGYEVYVTSDGGYIIAGYTDSFGAGGYDVYLIKTKPVITMVSPGGGEMWQGGKTYTIEWSPENPPDSSHHWRLLFSSDGGSTFVDTIADDLSAAARLFEWTVPLVNCAGCRVELELLDDKDTVIAKDISDNNFIIDITAPVIDSTTVWSDTAYGGPFEIETKTTDNLSGVDSVFLSYRRDEDADWTCVVMNQIDTTGWYIDSIPFVSHPGDSVRYYVGAIDGAGILTTDPQDAPTDYYSFMVIFTGVAEHDRVPASFLFGLQSNPIKSRAVFNLHMPEEDVVELRIYDVTGRLVDTPVNGMRSAGVYKIQWVSNVGAGIYFYELNSTWQNRKGKLVLIR